MNNIGLGTIVTATGILLLSFREWFARKGIEIKNQRFGLHMGEEEIQTNLALTTAGGMVAIVLGLLILFGVLHVNY